MNVFIILAAINAFLAVAFGAFGSHGLEGKVSERMIEIWKTGVTYQMFHTGGLFIVALLMDRFSSTGLLTTAGWAFFIGIIFFSGSLYILTLSGVKILGAITPIGGVAFLIGWVLIIIAAVKG
ncbi:DUF423 domain-containing protein [Sutcliffiella rhizosphaerae]|uniref:DUF423 domain-containing protein n=1 Tax=Sutcliffiella rhizosphaerae TaxID=2880967 RepID=A0ABN8AAC1_9BACI|nr:DUF423 domain-containing protein [Sutcliffiella rhizosphaerae]CAG9620073.1 hypothetical protein BACCIP111883_00841 [Sutcliffiella rhizosphaerae]